MVKDYVEEIRKLQSGQFQPNQSGPGVSVGTGLTLAGFLTQVYTWMALGLVLTTCVAFAMNFFGLTYELVRLGRLAIYAFLFAELGLVIAFGVLVRRSNTSVAVLAAMFIAYAALNGVTFSLIFLAFTGQSIASTFFISTATFASMAIFGAVTKKDLTGIGQFMMMGLFGIIIASIVNIFLQSRGISWGISFIAVGIFTVLTAWDTQKLKHVYANHAGDDAALKRLGLAGALELYLDFINLFIHLLNLLGKRK